MAFGDSFRLTLVTRSPRLAAAAVAAGIDRVGVDLEVGTKRARQAGLPTRHSDHTEDDLARVFSVVPPHRRFVRINAYPEGPEREAPMALAAGAAHIMLPWFHEEHTLRRCVELIRGRAQVHALVESAPALFRINRIVAVEGVDEVMFGLNDLRVSLGLHNHFEVLASPLLAAAAEEVHRAGIRLSIGGVAPPRLRGPPLPVPEDLVLAQYPRLGATGAWLARSYIAHDEVPADFAHDIQRLRRALRDASSIPDAQARLSTLAAALRDQATPM